MKKTTNERRRVSTDAACDALDHRHRHRSFPLVHHLTTPPPPPPSPPLPCATTTLCNVDFIKNTSYRPVAPFVACPHDSQLPHYARVAHSEFDSSWIRIYLTLPLTDDVRQWILTQDKLFFCTGGSGNSQLFCNIDCFDGCIIILQIIHLFA